MLRQKTQILQRVWATYDQLATGKRFECRICTAIGSSKSKSMT